MTTFAEFQESTLRDQASEEQVYADLLFFYAARRDLASLDALATDLDPKNEQDMLVFELFQGTEPSALVQLANADTAAWIRHALMKAFLKQRATEGALGLWRKCLQWQVPDSLTANLLVQYLLRESEFEQAGNVAAVSLKLGEKQRDVLLWKAMAQSRRTLDRDLYLDPMPIQVPVSLAITTQSAASYIEQTLSGIAAQSYPLAAVLVVDEDPGALPAGMDEFGPFQRVEATPGAPWIATAAKAAASPLLVTMPPDCAPAMDFVQQFILACENGAENLGAIGGRVEDFYHEKPGDRWRVARMTAAARMERSTAADAVTCEALCLDRAAVAALGDSTPTDVPGLAAALKATGRETLYLPDAVACGLRQDTIESALDAYWQHRLPERMRAGHFASAARLVSSLRDLIEQMVAFVNDDIEQGNTSLVYPDFFLFFHNALLDLQYGAKRGLLEAGDARVIQDALIEAMAPMDTEFKRDLRGKVKKMLGSRMIAPSPSGSLDAEVHEALQGALEDLKTLFKAFPQDLYLAIYG
jgi:hypothetical protein